MSRILILLVLPLVLAAPSPAQNNAPSAAPTLAPVPVTSGETARGETTTVEPEFPIEELVARALENNPQPTVARANLEAARQRAGALRSLPNPVLEVVAGFVGSEEARDEEILLSQPLDLFGQRRAQRKVLQAEARRAQAEITLVTRVLVVEVKNAAVNLFAAQEAESLGEVQVEVARAFRNAASRRSELGDVPPVQAQRAGLELLRVENDLTNARAERLIRRAVLNQLIGQAPEAPLWVRMPLNPELQNLLRSRSAALALGRSITPATTNTAAPGGSTPPTTVTPPLLAPLSTEPSSVANSSQTGSEAIGDTANVNGAPAGGATVFSQRGSLLSGLINRPDIVSAEATLEARRAQVDAIGRQRLPQVELQARRTAVFGEGEYALRAVVTAPIFDFGSIRREKRAAQADVRAQEAQIALLRSQAASQVEQALIRLDQQQATVERYRTGIVPQTLDLLRKTQIGFAAGASTYLEVLEAQRTLRAVQTEYLQALVGVRSSEAQLESALGATLPESLLGSITNPQGPSTPDGIAAPGTVPQGVFPPVEQPPLNPPSADLPTTNDNPGVITPQVVTGENP